MFNPGFFPRDSQKECIPAVDNFSEKYFNELRNAAKYNKIAEIKKLKSDLTKEQFLKLLYDANHGYTDCTILQYAAKYNRPEAIQALIGDLPIQDRLKISQLPYMTGCNALHFTATVNCLDNSCCSYEAAAKLKEVLYLENDHSYWIALMSGQQECLETPVHYAARQPSAKLLQLFSDGLSADEWLQIISIKNNDNNTAGNSYIANSHDTIDGSHELFIKALRGPLSDRQWTDFIIFSKMFKRFKHENTVDIHCFELITKELSPQLADELSVNWRMLSEASYSLRL
jgi:hypothetical protein